EVGPGEAVAVEAAVDGVAAAPLHAQQLGGALVELVVADGVEVEPDHVHRLDRRLVVEEGRHERAGPDQVAGRDHDRVAVGGLERGDVAGQVGDAAGVHGADPAARARGRLEVPVEVVEGEDLDLDLAAVLHLRRLGRSRGGGHEAGRGQPEQGEGRDESTAELHGDLR